VNILQKLARNNSRQALALGCLLFKEPGYLIHTKLLFVVLPDFSLLFFAIDI
jgi:hypothetical protein